MTILAWLTWLTLTLALIWLIAAEIRALRDDARNRELRDAWRRRDW